MTIELRVFGSLQLTATDGRDLESLLRQPKRTALLAYLATAVPRGFQRRDTLLALFWPELDDSRARAALNQALYILRNTLGDQGILTRGDGELALSTEVVWCDAVAFEMALDAGKPGDALALYGGEFLAGFFVSGAPEFERWVGRERERLRHRAAEGAWALAETKAAEGDAVQGARWARRAADLLPADEAVVRRLMSFLDRVGDRTAALRAYEAFAWRLRTEYELEPSAETQALAVALREQGSRPADVRFVNGLSPSPGAILVSVRRRFAPGWVAAAVLMLFALTTGFWASRRGTTEVPPSVIRESLDLPGGRVIGGGVPGSTIAFTPDGTRLAYLAEGEQGPQIAVRALEELTTVPVQHTRGAYLPFFSANGKWLGFVADGRIRKVPVAGGPAIEVTNPAATVFGATWTSSDVIVFATATALWSVPAGGGDARVLAAADTITGTHYRWPAALPGGEAVVVTSIDRSGFHLAAVSLTTRTIKQLGTQGTSPYFVAPGTLVFARPDGALLAAAFDEKALTISGPPVPIAGGVSVGTHGAAKVAVSASGRLAYLPRRVAERRLVFVNHRDGAVDTVPAPRQGYHTLAVSRDGRRIAAVVANGGINDFWVTDLERGTTSRVTTDSSTLSPVWMADDRRILFATSSNGREPGMAVKSISVDGSGSVETWLGVEHGQLPLSVTPDGSTLVFQRTHPDTKRDIWLMSLGSGTRRPFLATRSNEFAATVSPDGSRIAYVSDETGRDEIYVRSYPIPGPATRVSLAGGREPRWARDGNELFYRTDSGMFEALVGAAPALTVSRRRFLFDDRPFVPISGGAGYDVHPDGRRFVMIERGPDAHELIMVLGWFDDLRRRP